MDRGFDCTGPSTASAPLITLPLRPDHHRCPDHHDPATLPQGSDSVTAVRYSLRARPLHMVEGAAASAGESGRHSGARTRPGSRSSRPSKKRATSAWLRRVTRWTIRRLRRWAIAAIALAWRSLAGWEIAR